MSRRTLVSIMVAVSIAGTGIVAAAGNDRRRFENGLKRYAQRNSQLQADDELRPKGLCVCLEAGADGAKPGFLLWVDDAGGQVFCMIPNEFSVDGSYTGAASCPDWTALAR